MRRFLIGLSLAGGLAAGTPALAGPQTASGFWNDPYHQTVDQQALALSIAEAQQRARDGGYGPGLSTTNYNGTVNSYSTYNGTVESSGSSNIVNSNSTSVSTSNSSGLNLSIVTGQTSGDSDQHAGSQANNGVGGPNQ